MARKSPKNAKPQVNQELNGFDVQINEFGEIISTYNINKLNTFLDDKTDDKKFRGIDVERNTEEGDEAPTEKVWGY